MDLGRLMQGWVPYPPPRRVSVGEAELNSAIALVRALPCTTLRCRNAYTGANPGRPECDRCRAVKALDGLNPQEVAP